MDQVTLCAFIHLLTLGKEFRDAAEKLFRVSNGDNPPNIHDRPLLLLIAHSLELLLKAALTKNGYSQDKIREFDHDISRAYNCLKSSPQSQELIAAVEDETFQKFRATLKSERDDFLTSIGETQRDDQTLANWNVPSNAEIGNNAPKLQDVVNGLSNLHNDGEGSMFRYSKTAHIQTQLVRSFSSQWPRGKPLYVLYGLWATQSLYENLRYN